MVTIIPELADRAQDRAPRYAREQDKHEEAVDAPAGYDATSHRAAITHDGFSYT
ncbi:hypothetical protein [Candidatus Burkholderia verschuerenii]|uniref:hypothetical protein n=1 Tax=Candidatus Burkholderia verschuerenii TaxID=242163 RepID=UPI0012EEA292|nr:hypothetical protein [Candidatus Burkholderia verschuerenii]